MLQGLQTLVLRSTGALGTLGTLQGLQTLVLRSTGVLGTLVTLQGVQGRYRPTPGPIDPKTC